MELYELNPHIRYARLHKESFYSTKSTSICYDCRVFFFENITGDIVINGKKHAIVSGTAISLPPASRYHFNISFKKETRITVLDFDLCLDYSHIKSSLGTANTHNFDPSRVLAYDLPAALAAPIVKHLPKLCSLLTECTEGFINRVSLYRERSSAMLKLCLLEIADGDSRQHSELGRQVLEYVHKNCERPSLTNEEIAAAFNYHPYHVSRLVKKETGMALRSYVIDCRLRAAKDLLLTTRYSISDIAFRTGFCSSAYFTKIFKESTGMTPKDYRRRRLHTEI